MKKLNALFGISIVLILAALLLAYFVFINNPYVIALHFDFLRGIDYFGTRMDVFGVLLVALVINFTNTALAKSLYSRDNFLALTIAIVNAVFMALILVTIGVVSFNN